MDLNQLPDPALHRICRRCQKWFDPEEGRVHSPEFTGLFPDRPRFQCHRCTRIRTITQRTVWITLIAIVAAILIAERAGILEDSSTPTNAIRQESIVEIRIKLAGESFPSPSELNLRRALEMRIEQSGIGNVVDAGSGGGYTDIGVEVTDAEKAISRIRTELKILGLADHATVELRRSVNQ